MLNIVSLCDSHTHTLVKSHPWQLQSPSASFYVLLMHQHFTVVPQWVSNYLCTLAIYNARVGQKTEEEWKRWHVQQKFPVISMGILFCSTTDNLEITPSLSVYHMCFNHYIVYEIVLKSGGSFVQVLFGKVFSFFEMIKYVSIPRSVYGFDNCHLTVYWDPLELKLLREAY